MIGDSDLADVVHRARIKNGVYKLHIRLHLARQSRSVMTDSPDVSSGRFVPELRRTGEEIDRLSIVLLELGCSFLDSCLQHIVETGQEVSVLLEAKVVAHPHP